MNIGAGPIGSIYLGIPTNATIAASMAGTAAATQIMASASFSYARAMEIFNLTGQNIELIIGRPDHGTADYTVTTIAGTPVSFGASGQFFCPGTASSTVTGRTNRFPCAVAQGMTLYVRTTGTTNITCSSTNPFIINFWA